MSEKAEKILFELGYKPPKEKLPQASTPNIVQGRDLFQTPRYATNLLLPFIPEYVDAIWEPACGDGRMVQILTEAGYAVFPSDIRKSEGWVQNTVYNFLTGDETGTLPFSLWDMMQTVNTAIITNPPFSSKEKFYTKCREFHIPIALLMPADYTGWMIRACMEGAEKIIPTRRIDYITPNTILRVNSGEGTHYTDVNEVPSELLFKYSSSDFHSLWLTWGFNLGKTETYVELSLKEKKENI